jgi:hypothetical protein
MNFLRSSQNAPYVTNTTNNTNITQTQPQSQPPPLYMLSRRRFNMSKSLAVPLPTPVPTPVIEPPKPTMIWGPAIWFLLHTLAEKIIPENFQTIRSQLLNNIFSICTHLPCPVCSEHAKEYFGKINFNSIKTKEDLKLMLFQFHNTVNQRKGYPIFNIDELNIKYKQANTVKIIQNFMVHFKDKQRSPKLIADDLQRARIALLLQEWFQNNIQYFEL